MLQKRQSSRLRPKPRVHGSFFPHCPAGQPFLCTLQRDGLNHAGVYFRSHWLKWHKSSVDPWVRTLFSIWACGAPVLECNCCHKGNFRIPVIDHRMNQWAAERLLLYEPLRREEVSPDLLNFDTTDILEWVILCCGSHPTHWRTFGRISDAVINIPSQNVSIQERPNFLRGQNCPWWGITMLEGPESEPLLIVADFVKLAGCSDS